VPAAAVMEHNVLQAGVINSTKADTHLSLARAPAGTTAHYKCRWLGPRYADPDTSTAHASFHDTVCTVPPANNKKPSYR